MTRFNDHYEKVLAYRAVFNSPLGRKVLHDILANLFWIFPEPEPAWADYVDERDVQALRDFATFLMQSGGLEATQDDYAEVILGEMLAHPYQPRHKETTPYGETT